MIDPRAHSEPETPLEWALFYASRGLRVLPVYEVVPDPAGGYVCACRMGEVCSRPGKHPRTAHGFCDATTDPEQIKRWWTDWPNANIGIRTGQGILVLDIDIAKGGDESLELLERRYGILPPTRQALSGSGGAHEWYSLPPGISIRCFDGIEDGIDIRSDDGYVVVEPSIHITGNIYRWDGIMGFDEPVAPIPPWLLTFLTERAASGGGEAWRDVPIKVNRNVELSPALLDFIASDDDLSRIWNVKRSDLNNSKTGLPNYSSYDMALASRFTNSSFTPQQVADIITAFRLKHGNPKNKAYRLDYLQRTIWAASQNRRDRQIAAAEGSNQQETAQAAEPAEESNGSKSADSISDPASPSADGQQFEGGTPEEAPTVSNGEEQPDCEYRQVRGCLFHVKKSEEGAEKYIRLTNFGARISADINEDDGVEVKRYFKIAAMVGPEPCSVIIPANQFAKMDWPIESIGPHAIVYPNQKDWARAAIQSLSKNIQSSRIYTHTGWRKVGDSTLYLHGGGAIGANGAVEGVDVRLSGALAHYSLSLPADRNQLVEAIRASLRVLDLAPDHIAFPVLAASYRACIKPCDFATWLGGPTGVFKSELAALGQQHYGSAMDSRRLPGNFASTGNALEMLAFSTKDALLVIDDFAPHGGMQDVARYHAAADRILRAAGNNQGRGRLSSEARLREAKPPRGLILATGEDMPRGQSIRGRTLIIEVAPGDVNTAVLSECQVSAAEGLYVRSMAGFVRWIATRYDELQEQFKKRVIELRSRATRVHSRTPGIVADLYAGFELLLEFALSVNAITGDEKDALAERCWSALNKVAKAQQIQQDSSEPARRFLELLRAAIHSGEAHLAGLDGGAPGSDGVWGWQLVGSGDRERLVSRGKCVGWVERDDLYLEPVAAFAVAQEIGRSTGEPLSIGQTTLNKRLKEKGLLATTEAARGTLTIRKRVCGKSTSVLHLRTDALTAGGMSTDKVDASDQSEKPEVFAF